MTLDIRNIPAATGAPAILVDAKDPVESHDRSVRLRIGLAWGLLVLNTLTFYPTTYSGLPLIVPIPSAVGKVITQGALPVALLLILTVNRRMTIRPNAFLILVSLLAIEALLTSIHVSQIGNAYRSFRFAEFVVALWLLSPWWGRRDLLLIRCHLVSASLVLGSVVLGILVAPREALAQGRLEGVFWPNLPTQIAEFAAVTVGLLAVLWLGGLLPGRVALIAVPSAGAILILTHTRTALIALTAGLLVAGLSLFMASARVRRFFAAAGVVVFIGAMTLSGAARTWWARGENTYVLADLNGRTVAWQGVLNIPRNQFEMIGGFGLSDQSYNSSAIDNSWLIAYNDQGLFAVVVCATMLLVLFATACFRARGIQRALALFLVTYCTVTSFTESGISAPSTFLLYLALAASLLVPSPDGTSAPPTWRSWKMRWPSRRSG
jgi:hypothetical protein